MFDDGLIYLREVYGRRWLIVGVTCVAFCLSILKVLYFPALSYEAEVALVVSSPTLSGEMGRMVQNSFSPKMYEELATSPTVLQEVLDKLAAEGAFPDGETPLLEDFQADVSARLGVIDKTTRPVNYSPLLAIRATSESAELAKSIVNTWAEVAISSARKTNYLHVGVVSEKLAKQERLFRESLDAILARQAAEKSQFDAELGKKEMLLRLELLHGSRLQGKSQGLLSAQKEAAQDLAEAKAQLASVREALAQEEPFVQLTKAPSDDAVWLLEGQQGEGSDIEKKGMVTEELNQVYWELKSAEQQALQKIAGTSARLAALDQQIAGVYAEQEAALKEVAKHTHLQTQLDAESEAATLAFKEVAAASSLTTAIAGLVHDEKAQDDGTPAIGLNRLSDTVPVKRTALLGKKSTVIVFTGLAFALTVALILVRTMATILVKKLGE